MARELNTEITFDHTHRMRRVREYGYNRERTIYLRFTRESNDESFFVQAWGSAFPEDGGGGYQGRVANAGRSVEAAIDIVRSEWQRQVVDYHELVDGRKRHPFVDGVDLAGAADRQHLDTIGIELARAGDTLFWALFGDPGMKEITALLRRALRAGEHVITMESDTLFAPWGLLYTPPRENEQLVGPGASWSIDGFWGYRHLVEHNFSRTPGFDSRIHVPGGQVVAGLNVDRDVDNEHPPTPFIEPVIEFFRERTRAVVRNSKDELAHALTGARFDDHITYFGCHAEVSGVGGGLPEPPYLALGDKKQIRGVELIGWLAQRSGQSLPNRPLVFVSACQGGQLCSRFYGAFGRDLLQHGARCLLGPQIDLPRRFAAEYTTRLFSALLEPGTRLGDVVRALAREFADDHRNPLGLIFSLYRGLDVHFGPRDAA